MQHQRGTNFFCILAGMFVGFAADDLMSIFARSVAPDATAPVSGTLAVTEKPCESACPLVMQRPSGIYVLQPKRLFQVDVHGFARLPTKRVWVEVGLYDDTDFRRELESSPDLTVIAFEANPENVARIRYHARLFLAGAALGTQSGFQTFNQWSATGGSLLPLGPAHTAYLSEESRKASPERQYEVGVVRLGDILSRVAGDVNIEYIKVDAQGADLDVVTSAGFSVLGRVRAITVECQDIYTKTDPRAFYAGACVVSDLVTFMEAAGFARHDCELQNAELAEKNCHFGRNDTDVGFARDAFHRAMAKKR